MYCNVTVTTQDIQVVFNFFTSNAGATLILTSRPLKALKLCDLIRQVTLRGSVMGYHYNFTNYNL